ncbi:MAG: hypothetical protein ABI347_10385 [Nitrososphaera sp.]
MKPQIILAMALAMAVPSTLGAYAQAPSFQEISGQYSDEQAGLKITLPNGWKGFAVPSGNMTAVIVSPEQLDHTGSPANMMMVAAIKKDKTSDNTVPESVQQPSNVPEGSKPDCKPAEQNAVKINNMDGIVMVIECTTQDGNFYKTKIYSFQSEEKFFTVGYTATSAKDYDTNVGTFDNSVKTLQISNTIEAPAVPEFPVATIAAVAAVIGVVAVLGRTKFMR